MPRAVARADNSARQGTCRTTFTQLRSTALRHPLHLQFNSKAAPRLPSLNGQSLLGQLAAKSYRHWQSVDGQDVVLWHCQVEPLPARLW
jgi:hypothetical protein